MRELVFSRVTVPSDVEQMMVVRATYSIDEEQSRALYTRYMSEMAELDNRVIYLARGPNDQPIAYAQLVLRNADNDPDLADGDTVAHVHDLRVKSPAQAKGVGRQFMEFIESQARLLGKRTLTLGVDDSNERALRLYESLGYATFKNSEGRTPSERCLHMRKDLER